MCSPRAERSRTMATTALVLGLGAAAATIGARKAKKKLAKKLAKSLSDYFEVDPHLIESSLGGDTKLLLQQAKLKPLVPETGVRVEGVVGKLEFSWIWGGSKDGSTAFVRNAALTVSGARIRVVISKDAVVQQGDGTDNTDDSSQDGDADAGGTIQQIIDHINIDFVDLQVDVQVEEQQMNRKVVCEAKSITLVSLGRDVEGENVPPPPPLVQTITLEALAVHVESEGENFPFLDPFGYAAGIKRVAGKRFGGLDSGLQILGEQQQDIIMHAGKVQIETLGEIMNMKPSSEESSSASSSKKDQVDDDPYSTILYLPMPSVKTILPNGSAIRLPDFRFRFITDGTVCNLQSREGLYVNDDFHVMSFDNSARCLIDFTTSKFMLELTSGTSSNSEVNSSSPQVPGVAHIWWKQSEMRPVLEGMREVMDLISAPTESKDKIEMTTDSAAPAETSTVRPWSFSLVDGKISVRIEGGTEEEKQWVLGSLDAPASYVLPDRPDETPSKVSVGGITVGPTSFGDVSMRFQGATFDADTFSLSSLNNMQEFVMHALGMDVW